MASKSFEDANIAADVIVIGGGFGGCYALYKLRKMGYSVKLLEAGRDFGGVWHFNKYPGARVDSEIPLYQLSLQEAAQGFNFTETYPGYAELQAYFSHIAHALDLRKDSIFNVRINEAKYNAETNTWHFRSGAGVTATSKFAIFATGTTNKAYIPEFPGFETFGGQVIHPAAWPEIVELKGKKIGLIGQGASGLQIVQELSKLDCELTVFMRKPPTCLPMGQRSVSIQESEQTKNSFDALFEYAKTRSPNAYSYNNCDQSFYDASSEERTAHYERLWARGGYGILTSNYPEISYDKTANAELYQFWASKARARITDPVKKDIMAPLQQFQWIGGNRPNLEMDYFESVDRPNVRLVGLKQNCIREFTKDGVHITGPDGDKFFELDLVIAATGYDSVTGSLFDMNVHDKHGNTLQKKWKDELVTWLGMMVPDVPNAFFLYGPQAPSGLTNGPPFLELQVDWLAEFLQTLKSHDIDVAEVSSAAAREYREINLRAYSQSLMAETPSWWNGANIPGKLQEPLFWVAGLQAWREECKKGLDQVYKFLV